MVFAGRGLVEVRGVSGGALIECAEGALDYAYPREASTLDKRYTLILTSPRLHHPEHP
jgi:hypothetical protein